MKKTPISKRMRMKFQQHGTVFVFEDGMEIGRSKGGSYIGVADDCKIWRWLARYGMYEPQRCDGVEEWSCNIAKATKGEIAGKWVGWSHRASCAFGLGDMIFDASLLGDRVGSTKWSSVPFVEVGTQPIVTDDDARQAAVNFAEYVG